MKPWLEVPRCYVCIVLAAICGFVSVGFWMFVFIIGASIASGMQ